jgi:hypothetical protein
MDDGYAESIMVLTGVVGAVHHYVNFVDVWIMIAVYMVNMPSLQM